jgi:outer membrane receptor for ferrienterochelin and colicins
MFRRLSHPSSDGGRSHSDRNAGRFLVATGAMLAMLLAIAAPCAAAEGDSLATATGDLTELSLDQLMKLEVVYAASRHEQKLADAPGNVTIVSRQDIEDHGYRTLADVLALVRGFFVTSDRNYTYAGIRGFGRLGDYNTRILLMINGHRLNDNMYDMAMIGTESPVDLAVAERVEIVRGPGSSLYGTSAVFAVVNVVTRDPAHAPGLELGAQSGSHGTRSGAVSWGGVGSQRTSALLSATGLGVSGPDLYFPEFAASSTNGWARGLDDDHRYSLYGRATWKWLAVEAHESRRQKGIPTGAYGTVFGDGRTRTTDFRQFVTLSGEGAPRRDLELSGMIAYDRYDYRGIYVYDWGTPEAPDAIPYHDYAFGRWFTAGGKAIWSADRQTLIAGSEVRHNSRENLGGFDEGASGLDVDGRSTVWAIYSQHEMTLAPRLRSSIGLRYDHYPLSGGALNPRFAAILALDAATTLKLMAGRAFRIPNVYELYYGSGDRLRPAMHLDPEVLWSYEAMAERRITPELSAAASVFDYDIHGLIAQITDSEGFLTFVNKESADADGVELEMRGRWRSGVHGTASWSWQRTRTAGGDMSNSPRRLGKLDAVVPLWRGRVDIAPDLQYVSRRRTRSGGAEPAYALANLSLTSHPVAGRLAVGGTVYNLFDTPYSDPGAEEHVQESLPQDGRTWRVRFSATF